MNETVICHFCNGRIKLGHYYEHYQVHMNEMFPIDERIHCPICDAKMYNEELQEHLDWHDRINEMRGWL